jgi:transcriptional regulator GlxA family with amidase domain
MQTHIDRAMGVLRGSSLSLVEIAAACGSSTAAALREQRIHTLGMTAFSDRRYTAQGRD